jgi:hypothetical protein
VEHRWLNGCRLDAELAGVRVIVIIIDELAYFSAAVGTPSSRRSSSRSAWRRRVRGQPPTRRAPRSCSPAMPARAALIYLHTTSQRHRTVADFALAATGIVVGAGDENRTRTVSLGS